MTAPATGLTSWQALRLVTARELVARGLSKAFLLSGGAILVLVAGAVLLPQLLRGGDVIWSVGALGEGNDAIMQVAETIAREDADPDRDLTFEVTRFDDDASARAALAAGDVEIIVIDGREILRQGSAGFAGSDLQDAVQRAAATVELESRLAGSDVSLVDVAAVLGEQPLEVRSVRGVADAEDEDARSAIAYGGMVLLYVAILSYGSWTLMGIAEEKASRVVEVLLATVRPWQLLTGKILGIGLLGLAQFVTTIVWALVLVRLSDSVPLPPIAIDTGVTLVVWFTLGFSVYSVLYAMAGVLVSRMEDTQAVSFPITLIAIVGFLVSFSVLDDPSGSLGRITTYVPLLAPWVVPIRVAYGEIALWEHVLAVLTSLAFIIGLVRIAGRVYAGGLLHFGGRMRLRQAWRSAEIR